MQKIYKIILIFGTTIAALVAIGISFGPSGGRPAWTYGHETTRAPPVFNATTVNYETTSFSDEQHVTSKTAKEPWFENSEPLEIDQGKLIGRKYPKIDNQNQHVYQFFNIPYAVPPVDQLRFKAPIFDKFDSRYPIWRETRDATIRGNRCLQGRDYEETAESIGYKHSEDCLNLNIATQYDFTKPQTDSNEKLYPVLVHFHQGSFQSGSGNFIPIDSQIIAGEHKVVVVTANYRLNVLGFAGVENEFPPNSNQNSIGNMGLMDQYAVFNWISENIHKFGGDASSITTSGESAGAESSMNHLVWRDLMKKFELKGGIALSSPIGTPYGTLSHADTMLTRLAKNFNCTKQKSPFSPKKTANIECLQSLPAQDLVDTFILPFSRNDIIEHDIFAIAQLWPPTIDFNIVDGQLVDLYASGNYGGILPPILTGTAKDEAEVMVHSITNNTSGELDYNIYRAMTEILLHEVELEALTQMYPYNFDDAFSSYITLSSLLSDLIFHCPTRHALDKSNTTSNNYYYNWQHPVEIPKYQSPAYERCYFPNSTLACHADHGQWFFGNYKYMKYYQENKDLKYNQNEDDFKYEAFYERYGEGLEFSQTNLDLGVAFREMIFEFVNTHGLKSWPVYEYSSGFMTRIFNLDGSVFDQPDYRAKYCKFWDELDIYSAIL